MPNEKNTNTLVLATVNINDEPVGEIQILEYTNAWGQTCNTFCFAPEYLSPYGSRESENLFTLIDHVTKMFNDHNEDNLPVVVTTDFSSSDILSS